MIEKQMDSIVDYCVPLYKKMVAKGLPLPVVNTVISNVCAQIYMTTHMTTKIETDLNFNDIVSKIKEKL